MSDPDSSRPAELLAWLRQVGFALTPLPRLDGRVDGLYALRFTSEGFVDSIVIRGADYAVATRVPNVFSLDDPFQEPDVTWCVVGTLADVVTGMPGPAQQGRHRAGNT